MAASGTIGVSGLVERYAAALYALAEERGALDLVIDEIAGLGRLIEENADLRALIGNPGIDAKEAARGLDAALVAQGFSEIVRNFVGVVIGNRRLRDLPGLVRGFAAYVAARRGVVVAEIASAHALSDLQRVQLRARLTEAGYGNIDLHERVDPELLGGLTVKIGPRLYDTSLKSRLQRLHYAMRQPEAAQDVNTKGVA